MESTRTLPDVPALSPRWRHSRHIVLGWVTRDPVPQIPWSARRAERALYFPKSKASASIRGE
jgi:hypothetical protein